MKNKHMSKLIKSIVGSALALSVTFANTLFAKDIPGSSQTSYGVSASGTFQFSIPIVVPAGRNGMQPDLSLSYSGGGSGPLGVGWGISGLSSVTRCGKSIAVDGVRGGVQHDENDRFCLNGQRLLLVSGSLGAANSEYRTEIESFSKIQAIGTGTPDLNAGTSPAGWKVWAKDGTIFYYGSHDGTADSAQFKLPGTESIHTWKLERAQDRYGNFYEVTYGSSDGLPDEIVYGGTDQSIDFVYETKPDSRTMYVLGSQIISNKRLNRIVVRNNGAQVRRYIMTYEQAEVSELSRLKAITECGRSNADCMPDIDIQWHSNVAGYTTANSNSLKAPYDLIEYVTYTRHLGDDTSESGAIKEINRGAWADVNGDGRTDLIVSYIAPNGSEIKKAYLRTASGWTADDSNWHLPKPLRSYDNSIVNTTSARFLPGVINMGQFADVNGDGLVDLVYAYKLDKDYRQTGVPNNGISDIEEVRETYINTGNGWSNTPDPTWQPKDFLYDYISNGAGYLRVLTVRGQLIDLNGDGLIDWVRAYNDYNSSTSTINHVQTWINNGAGWSNSPDYDLPDVLAHYRGVYSIPHGQFVDVNGDGLVDWVRAYHASTEVAEYGTWLNTGTNWISSTEYQMPELIHHNLNGWNDISPVTLGRFVDVNGDGLVDWVRSYETVAGANSGAVRLNTGNGWGAVNAGFAAPTFRVVNYRYSTFEHGWPVNQRGNYMDVNKDGLIDYVESYKSSATNHPEVKKAWINTGTSWQHKPEFDPTELYYDYSGRENAKSQFGMFVDINSDGGVDWVTSRVGIARTAKIATQPRFDQLETVTTNMGVVVKPTFAPLTSSDLFYEKEPAGMSVTSTAAAIAGPMYVTAKLEVTNALESGFNEVNYTYAGAQTDRLRGFLGFYRQTSESVGDRDKSQSGNENQVSSKEFYQSFPFAGRVKRARTWVDGVLLSDTNTTYGQTTTAQGTIFVYPDNTESKSYDFNSQALVRRATRDSDFDLYGNLDLQTTKIYSNTNQLLQVSVVDPTYNVTSSELAHWQTGLLDSVTTWVDDDLNNASGEPRIFNESSFTYSPDSKAQLEEQIREPNGDEKVRLTTEFGYDGYGNVISQVLKSTEPSLAERENEIEYTRQGASNVDYRLPLLVRNSLGHEVTVDYHPQCDQPSVITDANGLTTTFAYDNYCRETKVTDNATGIEEIVEYASYHEPGFNTECSGASPCSLTPKFKVTSRSENAAVQITAPITNYYSGQLLPVLSTTYGMDGAAQVIQQTSTYDEFGRTLSESEPHFAGDAAYSNQYHYDALSRIKKVVLPYQVNGVLASKTNSITFANGLVKRTSTDVEGNSTISYANALGQIVKIEDAHGEFMHYRYYTDGQLKETEDAGVDQNGNPAPNIIQVGYDVLGRRTSLNDPDLGLSNYEYNAFGDLVSQEDAKDQVISMVYDKLGRLVQRTVPPVANDPTNSGATSTWHWDELIENGVPIDNGNGIGSIALVEGPNNYSQKYFYEANTNRVSQLITTIKGINFEEAFEYHPTSGFLSKRHYPDSGTGNPFAVTYNYQNGYLASVGGDDQQNSQCVIHWQADEYDALGRTAVETLGTLVRTTRSYKPGQNVLERIKSVVQLGNFETVQDLVYTYDGVNNLSSRIDMAPNAPVLNETFEYDNLYRLTEHYKQGALATSVTYDAIGNITYKSDVGNYTYGNQAGPHAVTRIELPTGVSSLPLGQFEVNWEWDGNTLTKPLPSFGPPQPSLHGQDFTYDELGNVTEMGNRSFHWTAFDKPIRVLVEQPAGSIVGSEIEYDAEQNRIYKAEATFTNRTINGAKSVTEETIYLGKDYQRIVQEAGSANPKIIHRYTLNMGGSTIQIDRDDGTSFDRPKYFLADNLGSTNVILDSLGQVEQRLAFDPWGMRMNVGDTNGVNKLTNRGYTGHEMDDETGLINMNARLYDPYLGRFLSADPVLPDPTDMQQFNRYSYVGNNPLAYTDPSGNNQCQASTESPTIVEEIVVRYPAPCGRDRFSGHPGAMPPMVNTGSGDTGTINGADNNQLEELLDPEGIVDYEPIVDDSPGDDEPVGGEDLPDDRQVFESNPLLRAVIPGQVSFDIGMSHIYNEEYLAGAGYMGLMLAEQVLTVLTFGQGQSVNFARSYATPSTAALSATKGITGVPGRVQSRINLQSDGFSHTISRHLNPTSSGSQFSLSRDGLASLLQSKEVVSSPITRVLDSGNFLRVVNVGKNIGFDKFNGNKATSTLSVITDKFGNLVTASPGVIK